MSTWIPALLPFLVALAIFLLPGGVVAMAAGLRGLGAVALAPLLSASVLAVSAIAAPWVRLSWSAPAVLVGTAAAAILTFVVRRGLQGRSKVRPAARLHYSFSIPAICGLLIASLMLLYRLVHIFGQPEFVSQTADNVFHLNAVRYILQTGNASSLTVGGLGTDPPSVYPALWHGVAALIVQFTGATIPVSVSALNLAIGGVVWPLSVWFMVRTMFRASWPVSLGFGVLAAGFSAFPYLLVDWGVLYPNFLGMALLPAGVGLGFLLAQRARPRPYPAGMLLWLLLLALPGLALAHPNTLLCAIVILGPLWLGRLTSAIADARFRLTRGRRIAWTCTTVLAVLVTAAVWVKLRPFPFTSFNVTWPPYQTSSQAIGEALLTTHSGRVPGWATAVLLAIGLYFAVRHGRYRWLVWSFLWWLLLFVAVTAWKPSVLRAFLTGGWFDDYKRIAAGMTVVDLPLALLGLVAVCTSVGRFLDVRVRTVRWNRVMPVIPAFGIAAAALVVSQHWVVHDAAVHAQSNYSLGPGSPIMSADEWDLYRQLPALVPADEVIADNPWDGSAWAYLASGRKVMFPAILTGFTPDSKLLADKLNQAASDPRVCAAAKRLHVGYAINSDELIYLPGNSANQKYPGIAGLDHAQGFKLMAQVGGNRLYKLTACQ